MLTASKLFSLYLQPWEYVRWLNLSNTIICSTLFNFLHQNPLKHVFSGYFILKISPLLNTITRLENVNAPRAFIREYTVVRVHVSKLLLSV